MKQLFEQLFAGEVLTKEQTYSIMENIGQGQLSHGEIAALLTVFCMRPISTMEFLGFRTALYDLCKKVNLEGDERIDIVGSGGDGKNTFNISTLSCFVVAGAGYKVSKHGNYASTSISGSSNVLQSLGYQFTNDESLLNRQLSEANICFLHAPLFHPAMGQVAPVRKALPFKTFFNIMGPTINPSQPSAYLLGAYSKTVASLYAEVMEKAGYGFTVVHNIDGYDEVSLTDGFLKINAQGQEILFPTDIGFQQIGQEDLYSGDTIDSAKTIFLNVLENKSTSAQKNVVLVNSGLAIQTLCPEKSISDCIAEAEESLQSGKAKQTLTNLLNAQ
ncbi:anthranilate phosphoribosyltransferase [Membranihabitans marinus]|uniref:anthranilate phosphoribosyltransferase n=1 Tax=Membranihabitans marinus TaxID=1227546 RepID=UPI001EFF818F|nr:anthranilate phosphoribosyltransferase [Membranihabitans marinus]